VVWELLFKKTRIYITWSTRHPRCHHSLWCIWNSLMMPTLYTYGPRWSEGSCSCLCLLGLWEVRPQVYLLMQNSRCAAQTPLALKYCYSLHCESQRWKAFGRFSSSFVLLVILMQVRKMLAVTTYLVAMGSRTGKRGSLIITDNISTDRH